MKSPRRVLLVAAITYLVMWCLSAIIVYPGRLIQAIDYGRKDSATHPCFLGRSINFTPGLAWVDWEEGDGAFNCAGFHGVFHATPFGTKLLWKRMTWIS